MRENGYHAIAADLRRRIDGGEFAPGETLTPENTLCKAYGVGRTTLRRALAVLTEEGVIEKRPGYGTVVRPAGEALTLVVFVICTPGRNAAPGPSYGETEHHFISPVYREFAELCRAAHLRCECLQIRGTEDRESFRQAMERAAALVLADHVPLELRELARAAGLPCVLMSDRAQGFRSVLCDNDSGLMQAVRYLAARGHRESAYLGGDKTFLNATARADGFCRAMEAVGCSGKPAVHLCGWTVQAGLEGLPALLEKHPAVTAVCAVNDLVALGAIRAAAQLGKTLEVVGFGDTLDPDIAQVQFPTVRISPARFAMELCYALRREMDAPYESPAAVLVEAELVIR